MHQAPFVLEPKGIVQTAFHVGQIAITFHFAANERGLFANSSVPGAFRGVGPVYRSEAFGVESILHRG